MTKLIFPVLLKHLILKLLEKLIANIKWITPAALGSINANFTSNLKLVAETTVPDTAMIYTMKSGKLPFGLILNYDGEIIGSARQLVLLTSLA